MTTRRLIERLFDYAILSIAPPVILNVLEAGLFNLQRGLGRLLIAIGLLLMVGSAAMALALVCPALSR